MNEILIAALALVLAPSLGVIIAMTVMFVNVGLWAGVFFCVNKTKQTASWLRRKAASWLKRNARAGEKE